MAAPPLATLRAHLDWAEKQRSRRYWDWREACMQVKRLTKELRKAEAQEDGAHHAD